MDFKVEVSSVPKGVLNATYEATLSDAGLMLEKRGQPPVTILRGKPATDDGKGRVNVIYEGAQVSIRVLGLRIDNKGLAQDLAAWLSGNAAPPQVSEYTVPGVLFVLALLPLAIPVITLGGMIPGAIGGGLAFTGLRIAKSRELSVPVRIAILLVIGIGGISAALALMAIATMAKGK